MLFHKIYKTLTCVAGTVSENTDRVRGMTTLIYVAPTTSTTTWDLKLTDPDGDVIYYKKNQTGTLRDREPVSMWGIHTITLLNTSANENFKVKIIIDERLTR